MSDPSQFTPSKRGILWFSRGRGRGHAIPDIEIIRALQQHLPDCEVRIVSYGTGARTFESFGYGVIDLGLPDAGDIADVIVMAGKLTGWLKPHLVVSHEEFTALPAAAIFSIPTVAILDFFVDPARLSMQCLRHATRILFTDRPGTYPEPDYLAGKVTYTRPVLRPFTYTRKQRRQARRELAVPPEAMLVTVLPGSWTEHAAPIADLVLKAFQLLAPQGGRLLYWVAGRDAQKLTGLPEIQVVEADWQIDRLMAASDVVLTKGSRKTMVELEALGIPSISLHGGWNPVDEQRARQVASNRALTLDTLTAESLAEELLAASQRKTRRTQSSGQNPITAAVSAIAEILDKR